MFHIWTVFGLASTLPHAHRSKQDTLRLLMPPDSMRITFGANPVSNLLTYYYILQSPFCVCMLSWNYWFNHILTRKRGGFLSFCPDGSVGPSEVTLLAGQRWKAAMRFWVSSMNYYPHSVPIWKYWIAMLDSIVRMLWSAQEGSHNASRLSLATFLRCHNWYLVQLFDTMLHITTAGLAECLCQWNLLLS